MSAPRFQVLVGDLRTGKITARISPTAGSWQKAPINGAGTMTGFTINTADKSLNGVDLYHATAPAKACLAVQYGNTILNAGPIWTRHYNRGSAQLTLGAAGLWSLFDHRLVLPVLTQPLAIGAAQAAVTTYPTISNLSLGDIAAALVAQALAHVGGNLPLVAPTAQGLTPGATRTYYGYDLPALGAMLTELTGVLNGPEIRFLPRLKASDPTSIEWVMQVGTPAAPLLTQGGADWYLDAAVPKSMVSDIDYDEDATSMGTRAWEVGAGSQAGTLLSQADSTTLTAVGYPLLEIIDRNHTSDSNQADLDGYAAAYLTQNNRPSAVWKITVRNDGAPLNGVKAGPSLDQYIVGDYAQVNLAKDPFLPPGTRRARIVLVEGSLDPGLESTITLATITAEV